MTNPERGVVLGLVQRVEPQTYFDFLSVVGEGPRLYTWAFFLSPIGYVRAEKADLHRRTEDVPPQNRDRLEDCAATKSWGAVLETFTPPGQRDSKYTGKGTGCEVDQVEPSGQRPIVPQKVSHAQQGTGKLKQTQGSLGNFRKLGRLKAHEEIPDNN